MASGDKMANTQLMAIYKLKFYRNKKKWKLHEDKRNEPPPSPTQTTDRQQADTDTNNRSQTANKLTKTYNVGEEFPEPEYDVEQVSLHNNAFLDEEPEDGPVPQPPDEPASLPVPEHNLYRSYSCPGQPWTVPEHNMYRRHSWPKQPWSGDKTDALCQYAQLDWYGAGAKPWSMPEELAYDQCDVHQHDLWTPASHLELRPVADSLEQLLQSTEDWMQRHGYPLRTECAATSDEYGLVDEIANFMRGAHEAPHSSEIDLSDTPADCPCTSDGLLYTLSERQLTRSVMRYHCALVHVLGEKALRKRLYSHSHLHPPFPFEVCPTRDRDPFWPDVVLSGSQDVSGTHAVLSSHGAVSGLPLAPDTGHGRGSLHQTQRVIGIFRGRPYRL